MTLVQLTADFPWGILLVGDADSAEQIPEWSSPAERVTSARSTLVMRVRHSDEGPVSIRALASPDEARGDLIYEGALDVDSGILRISDAIGNEGVEVEIQPGLNQISIFADHPAEATSVDIVVRRIP